MLKRLVKFALVGGSGTVIGLGILYLGTHVIGLYYLVSYVIAFCISVFNNYLWNTLWTFKGTKASFKGYAAYIGTSLFTLGITTLLMFIFTSGLHIWYMISSVLTTICGLPINFFLSKRLVWRTA